MGRTGLELGLVCRVVGRGGRIGGSGSAGSIARSRRSTFRDGRRAGSRSERPGSGALRQDGAGPAGFHGPDDDLGGDVQSQAVRVEDHVVVVRVGRDHPVHRAIELGPAAIEISGRPPGGPHRHAHPLGQAEGPDSRSGAMIRTERVVSRGSMNPAPRPTSTDSPARPMASISLAR